MQSQIVIFGQLRLVRRTRFSGKWATKSGIDETHHVKPGTYPQSGVSDNLVDLHE